MTCTHIEINQSSNSCTNIDNIKVIYQDIYSLASIKILVNEK
jgi:hypothetical protein